MKRLLVLFLVILTAAILGILMYSSAGYVLISYKNWTMESTLWGFLIAIILLLFALKIILAILNKLFNAPIIFSNWSSRIKTARARKSTRTGLHAWARGKWRQAEQLLIKGAKYSDIQLINYLAASQAANEQYDYRARDAYLQLAEKIDSEQGIAVAIVRAKLLISNHQIDQAKSILMQLRVSAPKNPLILKLLLSILRQQQAWHEINDLLPYLTQCRVVPSSELEKLQAQVYKNLLAALLSNNKISEANTLWEKIPAKFQSLSELIIQQVELLKHNDQEAAAEKILRKAIKKEWHDELIYKYADLNDDTNLTQLSFAESLLEQYPNNAALLFCLGKTCKKQKLWGKAQSYLEASSKINESKEILIELATLQEQLGNQFAALELYKKAVN